MKLILRFALIYLMFSAAIFVMLAFSTARREQARLEREAQADVRDLGYGLATALSFTFETGGLPVTRRAVSAIAHRAGEVDVVWDEDVSTGNQLGGVASVSRTTDSLSIRVPVVVANAAVGSIVLSRSLPRSERLFWGALVAELPGAIVLSVAVSLVAIVLGGTMIGKPLHRIVAHARRVGSGDYSARLRTDRSDEIGELKREMNTMCERLETARHALADEAAARLATLEELRHLDRLRTVGTIASNLAHELGTPLNVLLLRGQTLASGKASDQDAVRAGEVMIHQVDRMSRIVRQILDYARKAPPSYARLPLIDVVRRTVDLLAGIAKKSSVVFDGPLHFDGFASVSETLFEQALTNVLMNAVHAMPSGGTVRIRLRRDPEAKAEGALRAFAACVVDIEDQGVGVDADTLSRLFEPFYTTRERGKGTGLGLPVAKGIIEEHGGFIHIVSEVGKGTTVSIHLPEAP